MIGRGGETQKLHGNFIYSYYVSEIFTDTQEDSQSRVPSGRKVTRGTTPLHIRGTATADLFLRKNSRFASGKYHGTSTI